MFDNPYYKKIKSSVHLEIRCASCQTFLMSYQKVGKGNLRILHIERIIESSFNFYEDKILTCPNCKSRLGIYDTKLKGYRMQRASTSDKFLY